MMRVRALPWWQMKSKAWPPQTAKATEEITIQVNQIRGNTSGVVEALKSVTETINEVDAISTAIASSG